MPPERDPTFLTAEGGFQQALSVGAGLGSIPPVGTGALGIGSVIFFMVLLLTGRVD